jgi:cell division protein FtsQ
MRRQAELHQAPRRNEVPPAGRRHPLIIAVGAVAFCLSLVIGYLTQLLVDPTFLPIRKITVDGQFQNLSTEHVQKLVSGAVDGGFFNIDVATIRERIIDEPWIHNASVRRVWPDTIRVSIEEQHAVASWGRHALLNNSADIFVPDPSTFPAGLASLHGPVGTEAEMLERYRGLRVRFAELGLYVYGLELSARRAWKVRIDDGVLLVLGREAIDGRLDRFEHAYQSGLREEWGLIAQIDLRYTNGIAVRPKDAEIVGRAAANVRRQDKNSS